MNKHPKYVICPNPMCNMHVRLTRKQRKLPLWQMLCSRCQAPMAPRIVMTVA